METMLPQEFALLYLFTNFCYCYFFDKCILLHTLMQILKINPAKKDIDSFVAADFELVGYDPHQEIEMKMAV